MLSQASRPYIDASVPVLREHGGAITRRFYARMFEAHPELKNVFNMGNQASGVQQQALAAAVFAYAANIDNAAALGPVVERIVHKHASVGIKPAHYPIVARHLLGAIKDVLGDAATPELLAAWDEAYWLLAGDLIAAEARLYERSGRGPGELRPVTVTKVEREGDDAVSYYLQAPEGGAPGTFEPGQYVSVAVDLSHQGLRQLRQYSLSDAKGKPWWRITVKAEAGQADSPAGLVSNWLHAHVKAGDTLQVSAAFGEFVPELRAEGPITLLSGGVGITPLMSVLLSLAEARTERPVTFAHAARNGHHHALRSGLAAARASMASLRAVVFYEHPTENDRRGVDFDHVGRMDLEQVLPAGTTEGSFYLCGPTDFMRDQWRGLVSRGVDPARIHREVFGPDLLQSLS